MKLYLAKSNKCNNDTLLIARKNLKEFDLDIIEYKGGGYTHHNILISDILFVIPEENKNILGKGLFTEIDVFLKNNKKCYIISDKKCHYATEIFRKNLVIKDENDYYNYAIFNLSVNPVSLEQLLPNKQINILL